MVGDIEKVESSALRGPIVLSVNWLSVLYLPEVSGRVASYTVGLPGNVSLLPHGTFESEVSEPTVQVPSPIYEYRLVEPSVLADPGALFW